MCIRDRPTAPWNSRLVPGVTLDDMFTVTGKTAAVPAVKALSLIHISEPTRPY